MSIVILVLEPIQYGIIHDFLVEHVVELVRDWVKSPLLKFLVNQVITHLESNEEIGLLVNLLQHGNLIISSGCSLENPPIGLTVWHL